MGLYTGESFSAKYLKLHAPKYLCFAVCYNETSGSGGGAFTYGFMRALKNELEAEDCLGKTVLLHFYIVAYTVMRRV